MDFVIPVLATNGKHRQREGAVRTQRARFPITSSDSGNTVTERRVVVIPSPGDTVATELWGQALDI